MKSGNCEAAFCGIITLQKELRADPMLAGLLSMLRKAIARPAFQGVVIRKVQIGPGHDSAGHHRISKYY